MRTIACDFMRTLRSHSDHSVLIPFRKASRELYYRMPPIDKHNSFDNNVFTYRSTRDGRVMIYWYNKQVTTLKNADAARFLRKVEGKSDEEAQLVMAKITGNFKRGNER